MILDRSREPDALAPLPEELEQAVAGLRAFVEPTPEQLELSYQRVQQALGFVALTAAAPEPPAPPAPPPLAAATARAPRALQARRTLWVTSGGLTAVALLAGFVIGRWTSVAPEAQAPPIATAVLVPPAAPLAPSDRAAPDGPTWVEDVSLAERGALIYRDSHSLEPVTGRASSAARGPITAPSAARRSVNERAASAIDRWCPARDPLLRAECLLRRQQPQRALTALSGASTVQERERERVLGLTLLARCQLGQEVLSLGKQFFARWPASPLTWRIRNECPKAEPNVDGSLQRADVGSVLAP